MVSKMHQEYEPHCIWKNGFWRPSDAAERTERRAAEVREGFLEGGRQAQSGAEPQ